MATAEELPSLSILTLPPCLLKVPQGAFTHLYDIFLSFPSTYSVISPEGCASILWRDAEKAPQAAEAMGLIAPRLKELELIDEIIEEPLGGAHRNHVQAAANIKAVLIRQLDELAHFDMNSLLERRYHRLMSYGYC